MKNKHLLILPLLALGFTACQKETDTMPGTGSSQKFVAAASSDNDGAIGVVPASFTQKALLENITGATFGKCPDSDYRIGISQSAYPNRVICASFHTNDGMTGSATSELLTFLSGPSAGNVPVAALNRMQINGNMFNPPSTWSSDIGAALSTSPVCGLSIQSTINNPFLITATIHVGFNTSISANLKMVAYLTENNVTGTGPGFDQANDFNNDPASPFFNMGNPIMNYTHNNVVRMIITPVDGYAIPSAYLVKGGHFIQQMLFDVSSTVNITESYITAFVYNTSTMQIINVQTAKVGTSKSWD